MNWTKCFCTWVTPDGWLHGQALPSVCVYAENILRSGGSSKRDSERMSVANWSVKLDWLCNLEQQQQRRNDRSLLWVEVADFIFANFNVNRFPHRKQNILNLSSTIFGYMEYVLTRTSPNSSDWQSHLTQSGFGQRSPIRPYVWPPPCSHFTPKSSLVTFENK